MDTFNAFFGAANSVLLHQYVLFVIMGAALLFTIWMRFMQFKAVTHGTKVVMGKYSKSGGDGALTHFQALSAALSATVGLGNIGGVAIAVALGGPGAVLWMWIVGFFGMALKSAEVTLTMLYRNTDDPENPHGGSMWVLSKALAEKGMPRLGKFLGGLFCITVVAFAITGGNMFQAWNVGDISNAYFGVEPLIAGFVLLVLVSLVMIGGIKRIGQVAGMIVPFMCGLYVLAGLVVLAINIEKLPGIFVLIFESAFGAEAGGAFIGGSFGLVFVMGMKRALFSSEAGLGSAPMAHAAVKSPEPVREGVVAGLEPFIDTLVVCTITALVLLSTGIWNRGPAFQLPASPAVTQTAEGWKVAATPLANVAAAEGLSAKGDKVFMLYHGDASVDRGNDLHKVLGEIEAVDDGSLLIKWAEVKSSTPPKLVGDGVYSRWAGATLTAKAFDSVQPGLGKWLVTIAVWLFALSTIISWGYYGEQGMVFMLGDKSVMPYRIIYCALILVACTPLISTDVELDNFSTFGMGLMLWINIPLTVLLGAKAVRAYKHYMARHAVGEF